MFADMAKGARKFGSPEAPWDGKAPVDERGWPTGDCGVVLVADAPVAPGTYKLSLVGRADVGVVASAARVAGLRHIPASNTTTADIVVENGAKNLFLSFKNARQGIRDLKVMRPGTAAGDTFSKPFLAALGPFTVLRLMDLTCTNNNPVIKWAERARPEDPSQATERGVAWEYGVALANQAGKDLWINIPDQADDDYVRQLAGLLKKTLPPERVVWVEWSNEVWNWQFPQATRNQQKAEAEVAAGQSPLNADGETNRYYWGYRRVGKRIVEISNIFREVYGFQKDDPRFYARVRPVLASQIANPFMLRQQLEYIERTYGAPRKFLFAVAGAPYFNIPEALSGRKDATVDQILAALGESINRLRTAYVPYQTMAAYYQLRNVCYEGGVDLTGETNLQTKLAADADRRMQDLLVRYLNDWYASGGELFAYYSLCGAYSKYGTWGLTEDLNKATPKFSAIRQVATQPRPAVTAGVSLEKLPVHVPATAYAQHWGGREVAGAAPYVTDLKPGDTLDYLLRTPAEMTAMLTVTAAATAADATVEFLLDGELLQSFTSAAATDAFTDTPGIGLKLGPGLHTLRLRTRKPGLNIQAVHFAAKAP